MGRAASLLSLRSPELLRQLEGQLRGAAAGHREHATAMWAWRGGAQGRPLPVLSLAGMVEDDQVGFSLRRSLVWPGHPGVSRKCL